MTRRTRCARGPRLCWRRSTPARGGRGPARGPGPGGDGARLGRKSGRFGAARDRDDDIFSSGSLPGLTQGGVTRWDLSRLAPVADATCAGRLPPSLSRAGLARATFADDSRDAFCAAAASAFWSPASATRAATRGRSRSWRRTTTTRATRRPPRWRRRRRWRARGVGDGVGGARASSAARWASPGRSRRASPSAARSATASSGRCPTRGTRPSRAPGRGRGAAAAHGEAPLRSLTWRSALVDPPRRVRRLVPAPRGRCARRRIPSAASPSSAPPRPPRSPRRGTSRVPRRGGGVGGGAAAEGSHARVAEAAAAGLGPLRLAVRSPGRNGGAVELWDVAGCREKETGGDRAEGARGRAGTARGGRERRGAGGNGEGRRSPEADGFEASGGSRGAVRLLQAATPFGLAGAGASRATANAQAVAAARCYLLDAEGTLREVSARAR